MKNIFNTFRFLKPLALISALLCSVTAQAYFMNPATGFMAVGHGPEWRLDITFNNNTMMLKTADSESTYRYYKLGPTLRRGEKTTIYRVHSRQHVMNVVVVSRFCQDTENGKAYTATVIIRHDDMTYTGCGTEVVPAFEN
jgi:uncharacterized membrane protein